MSPPAAVVAVAHRGGALDGLENTLAAFRRAYALGYRDLETDVHATRDGVLVAFHDARLERVTQTGGAIAELDADELRRLRVGGREPIPLLAELLDAFPDCRFVVDPKSDAAVAPLAAVLRAADAVQRVTLGCFSQRRLGRLRRLLPGAATAAGPLELRWTLAVRQLRLGPWALPRRPAVLSMPVRHGRVELVEPRLIALAHARGLGVHVWTVNAEDEMQRLLDLGVDALVTDELTLLRDVLRRRGLWAGPEQAASP